MDFRDVRKLYDIHVVTGSLAKNIVCPFPQHRHENFTPSLSIYVDKKGVQRFRCHGACGAEGDVIDFMGHLNIAGYDDKDKDHVLRAISYLRGNFDISPPVAQPKPTTLSLSDFEALEALTERGYAYMDKRGVSRPILDRFRVRQKAQQIAIPTFVDGVLTMIKYRNMGSGRRYWNEPGGKASIFNHDEVAFTKKPVLIVKGEIAAMVVADYGFHVCAPNSGESATLPEWAGLFHFSPKRVVVGDNDQRDLGKKRAEILNAELRYPPLNYVGVDDWLNADPNAARMIRSWISL